MLARVILLLFLALAFHLRANAQDVRIGVFGLFHPRQLTLQASRQEAVIVQAAGQRLILEPGSRTVASLRISNGALLLDCGEHVIQTAEVHASARNNGAVSFFLTVPGKSLAPIAVRLR